MMSSDISGPSGQGRLWGQTSLQSRSTQTISESRPHSSCQPLIWKLLPGVLMKPSSSKDRGVLAKILNATHFNKGKCLWNFANQADSRILAKAKDDSHKKHIFDIPIKSEEASVQFYIAGHLTQGFRWSECEREIESKTDRQGERQTNLQYPGRISVCCHQKLQTYQWCPGNTPRWRWSSVGHKMLAQLQRRHPARDPPVSHLKQVPCCGRLVSPGLTFCSTRRKFPNSSAVRYSFLSLYAIIKRYRSRRRDIIL